MKYAIITPTFKPHFKYVKKYLESYKKFVTDKEDVILIFTISKNEAKDFKKITDQYCENVKFETLYFEDILKYFGITLTPDELLKKYQKFTFQTLKKFYTMLYSDADRFLVLDSESMWIKETNMKGMFGEFFSAPFLSYSMISEYQIIDKFKQGVIDNTNFLLGQNCDRWFLENFVWFYDKNILNDLFNEYGSPIEMAEKVYNLKDKQRRESGIFEIELYQTYLYNNIDKYNYNDIDVNALLKKSLADDDLKIYLEKYYILCKGGCGLLEKTMSFLNNSNYQALANAFKDSHFNIIRCDKTDFDNIELQEKFLDIVQPNILAASQEHAFGINDRYKTLIADNKYTAKVIKHWSRLINPTIKPLQWFLEPFSLTLYCIKWIIKRQSNIKKYNERYGKTK